jgi:acyl transferase domain-containing protein/NADPH:quinone reductase-like Zn-dependent oxidoreductase/NADP-dependent 3-hydroxy acid dehydrogenase YdfG/acyl carrier protein
MTEKTNPGNAAGHSALLKQALRAVEQMKQKLDAADARQHQPIAIIGIGCRFPGEVYDPASFWELLKHGREALSAVPPDRWNIDEYYDPDPSKPGKMVSRVGGFLSGVDFFDAGFFGIAPREAAMMDPQQRLLLEVVWEALENTGIAPRSLAGSRVGMYLGIASGDYAQTQLHAGDASLIDVHFASGNARSVASGRLSYLLGLKGPSLSVDTACSSSLVAVHLACQALRARECSMAIAGGVNVILAPETTVALSQAQMMSPDGRCRAFDDRANGFVRAEGCGVVLLKSLDRAQADGDPILAVIRGTALNQDGASSSLTVPNGPSQEELMRRALQEADRTAMRVGYVEAHGTGTSLGDPIELRALGSVYGASHKAGEPVLVGSLKTNFGHMEAAAGVGGLIKLVLALQHGEIPAHLNFQTPTSHVPWDEIRLAVPRSTMPWPTLQDAAGDLMPRVGAVSSFGFSGTNAHLVVEQAPTTQQPAPVAAGEEHVTAAHILPLSASSSEALRAVIERYERWLSGPRAAEYDWAEITATAASGRNHFRYRAALVACNKEEAVVSLRSLMSASDLGAASLPSSVCFLFTGQGSEHSGMGLDLLNHSAVFRDAVERLEHALDGGLPSSIAAIWANEHGELGQASLVQPALYAYGWALSEFWRSCGVEPEVVLGHSLGEYVAATVAGVMTPEEGIRLVAARGRLTQDLGLAGGMIAIIAGEEEVRRMLAGSGHRDLSIAAVNGPLSVVVSGGREAIQSFEQGLSETGVRHKRLQTTHGFHSAALDAMLDTFEHEAATVPFRVPDIRWISNLTGQAVDRKRPTEARYWRQHLRQTVEFQRGLSATNLSGAGLFLEVGPEPQLLALAEANGIAPDRCVASLSKRGAGSEWQKLLSAVAQIYRQGVDIDWKGLTSGRRFRRVPLPTYPFQRQRFWFTQRGRETVSAGVSLRQPGHFPAKHPLLGARLRTRSEAATFHAELTPVYPTHLGEHVVLGRRMLPGAAYLETALAAARQVTGHPHWRAVDVEFREPCFFDEPRLLETVVSAADANGRRQFEIASAVLQAQEGQTEETPTWTVHAVGLLEQASASSNAGLPVDLVAIQSRAKNVLDNDAFYKRFKAAGLDFGPAFQAVGQAWGNSDEGLVALDLAPEVIAESAGYGIHPIALDACLQAAAVSIDADASASPALPAALNSFHCLGDPGLLRFAHVKVRKREGRRLSLDIAGLDADGKCLLLAEGLSLMPSSQQQYRGWLHQVEWEPITPSQERNGEQSESLSLASVSLDPHLLQKALKTVAEETGLADFEGWMRDFDLLCSAWIADSFEQGGFDLTPGREFSSHDLLGRLSVAPQHHRLAQRFLAILCESDNLERLGQDRFRVLHSSSLDIASSAARLRAANHPEMEWTEQTIVQLVPLLRGEVSPLNVLFSEAGKQIATRLYRESVVARTLNPVLATAAVQAAVQLDRKVRVLEIGGGTAATTSYLVPALRGRVQEYVWTDLGAAFVNAARREFASVESMRFQTLDVERNPEEQGFAGELFDIVIASNVIHATADLKQTLGHIRSLQSPGGVLLIAETTDKQPWIDVTVGFTEGWWRFSDRDLRPNYALIGKQVWVSLLRESGFGDVLLLPDQETGMLRGQCLIAAVNRAQEGHPAAGNLQGTAGTPVLIVTAGSVAEPGPLASSLAQEAKSNGAAVSMVSAAEINQAALEAWFVEPPSAVSSSPRHIFYLPAAELATPSSEGTGTALNWQTEVLGGALACTQALLSGDHLTDCRFWFVSRGAFGPEISSPDGATLAAFARSLRGEYPEIRATAVDLPANADAAQELWRLARENSDTAMQVAVRGDRVWVPRLAPYILPQNEFEKATSGAALEQSETRRLRFAPSGLLEDLEPATENRHAPASDELEIAIGATAINFHEVLNALKPGSAHDVAPGGECAGVVVRVGDRVSGLQAGDRVVAIGSGLMADFATLPCDRVWKMPDGMTEEDAATLLIPFLTARWCLDRVARLQTGERVLVHAGAGGVGLAAIQEAKRLGALVYATAGSDAKREYLRSLGVEGVFESRSTSFEFDVLAATSFRGVDVVLNSLSGDKIAAGMRSLAPRGRFIELGEHTVLSDSEAQALRPDVSYHRVHLRTSLQTATPEVRDMIASILSDVAAGRISPLPWKRFVLEDAAAAFRYMAAGQHTGRVLLAPSSSTPRFMIRRDGAYVVTGGFSGLGRLTVEWLAEQGAGCVMTLARSEPDAETQQLFAQLQQKGTEIVAVRCDVSDEASLTAAIDEIPPAFALRGVFHAAGVLDDGGLPQQTPSRFSTVLAPKVAGAWNLHRLTRSAKLDCFVLFSSAAGVFGSRGQSNHAAANAYLDALVHYRRERLGLNALSVNWGAWRGTGAAVRHNVVERGERIGVDPIPPADGFRVLERLLEENCTQTLVSRVDWARWADHEKAEAAVNADLLTRVLHGPKHSSPQKNGVPASLGQAAIVSAPDGKRSWRKALEAAPQTRQLTMLEARVEERVRAVLCLHASQSIAATRPLQEYGLDSLLSIELRNALSSDLEAKLPTTTLFDYPTLASLTNYLFQDVLEIRAGEESAQSEKTPEEDLIGGVASLSDDEVEKLFQGKMAGI